MNMMQMMQKAQSIQKKLQETQAELAQAEYESSTGGVVAVCDGQGKFKSIKISKEAINPENPESVDDDTIEMFALLLPGQVKKRGIDLDYLDACISLNIGDINSEIGELIH